jgi:hydroxymethylpyrimidine pyrophosphatase-like HAD family hydrolase
LPVPAPNYDLIAIDLDGTLLGHDRRASARNIDAIGAARHAGLRVVICTGRGLVECGHILADINQTDPVVVAGGSIVGCPVTRGTLHRFPLDPALVARATRRLLSHKHPVMVLKDPAAAGYDYLMVVGDERHPLDPVTQWWLNEMNVRARYCCRIQEDEHPEHTVRLGVCGLSGRLAEMMADLEETFAGEATMHHFPAVVAPEHARHLPTGEKLHILEVFSKEASKWSAIQWLAARHGTPRERICAIGDEINDLPMISRAGLGIAMGNAVDAVKRAAARHTLRHDEHGVAHAIEHILAGRW